MTPQSMKSMKYWRTCKAAVEETSLRLVAADLSIRRMCCLLQRARAVWRTGKDDSTLQQTIRLPFNLLVGSMIPAASPFSILHAISSLVLHVFRRFGWEQIDSVVGAMQPRIEGDTDLVQYFMSDAQLRGKMRQYTVSSL